jgi:ABC-type transport system substrate-binding protein
MKKFKTLLCIPLAAILVFSLAACGDKTGSETGTGTTPGTAPGTETETTSGGESDNTGSNLDEYVTRTVGTNSYLGRFLAGINPAESWMGCDALFDTVFRPDPETKQRFSYVLKSWEWEDDTTLVMYMRDDIYFSNGENATAEDLIFSYKSHVDRGSNYLNDFGIIWEETVARDNYTAQFKLEKPYVLFLNTSIYLIDKSSSEERGWDSMLWYTDPITSGPYKVKEYVTDDYFVLESRGDDYWFAKELGAAYVDEWKIKYYGDDATLFMALETGDVDLAVVSAANYARYEKEGDHGDGYTAEKYADGSVLQFCFNFQDAIKGPDGQAIWYNKNLREALAIGIDWAVVGQNAMGAMYMEARSIAPTSSPDFLDVGPYEYNPEKAMEILAAEGYGPGNPLKIHSVTMDNQMLHDAFETFEYYASLIGVEATFEFKDTSAALGDWLSPSNVDYGFWWAVNGSPTSELRQSISEAWDPNGVRFDYVDDAQFLEYFEVLLRSTDSAAIHQAGLDIQSYMHDNFLYVPTTEISSACGWRNDKFTAEQIAKFRVSNDNYQLSRLGLASSW